MALFNTHTPAAWPVALESKHRANGTFPGSVGEGRMGTRYHEEVVGIWCSRGNLGKGGSGLCPYPFNPFYLAF